VTSPRIPLETPDALLALGISKPVFDCKWPESRKAVEELWAAKPHYLTDTPYLGSQDGIEVAFVDAWRRWASPIVDAPWDEFSFRYATMGSTEAIRESLALHMIRSLQASRTRPTIHTLEGDYEGYAAEFEGYGGTVIRHDRREFDRSFRASAKPGDRVYLSQPSAIDGNVWNGFDAAIETIGACHGVSAVVDLTYVGLVAREFSVSLRNPVVDTIVFSLSKVFGVYYHRIGGAFSRSPLTGLYGNRWFKNPASLTLGTRLLEQHGPYDLPRRYAALQQSLTEHLAMRSGVSFTPSDVVLLANAPAAGVEPPLSILARGAGQDARLRGCLTPSFDSALAPLSPA
jgi:hypothetical protein